VLFKYSRGVAAGDWVVLLLMVEHVEGRPLVAHLPLIVATQD